MTYTTETVINAPVEHVAQQLGNRDKMHLWIKELHRYEHLSGEPGTVNATGTLHLNLGATVPVKETILRVEYPHVFSVRYEMAQGSMVVTSLLQKKGRKATAYALEHTFEFKGMLKLGTALLKPAFIKHSQKVMHNFKKMVEEEL